MKNEYKSIDTFISLSSINRDVLIEEIRKRLQIPIIKKYHFLSMTVNSKWKYIPSNAASGWPIFTIADNTTGYSRTIMQFSWVHHYTPNSCVLRISDHIYDILCSSRFLLQFSCESDMDIYCQLDSITETIFRTLKTIYE